MNKYNLKTGDLLLFDHKGSGCMGCFSCLIKTCTNSNITHVGMVLKDPDFIVPPLKGYYVWESNWEGEPDPQDGKIKFGVQITPFDEIYNKYKKTNSKIYIRRINCSQKFFCLENLKEIHKVVYDKIYDINPKDWIGAISRSDDEPQKTDRFWCSALVGYIYVHCSLLHPDTDWSILRPSDFSNNYLEYINGASLDEKIEI